MKGIYVVRICEDKLVIGAITAQNSIFAEYVIRILMMKMFLFFPGFRCFCMRLKRQSVFDFDI